VHVSADEPPDSFSVADRRGTVQRSTPSIAPTRDSRSAAAAVTLLAVHVSVECSPRLAAEALQLNSSGM
jgi:hypothetical protein